MVAGNQGSRARTAVSHECYQARTSATPDAQTASLEIYAKYDQSHRDQAKESKPRHAR